MADMFNQPSQTWARNRQNSYQVPDEDEEDIVELGVWTCHRRIRNTVDLRSADSNRPTVSLICKRLTGEKRDQQSESPGRVRCRHKSTSLNFVPYRMHVLLRV